MRSVADSYIRWQLLFSDFSTLADLKNAVREGNESSPCVTGLRSVCWKIFLLFGNFDPSQWQKTLSDSRSAYSALKQHFLRSSEQPNEAESVVDPLDDDQNSPWVILRQDEALKAEILQDVERCMPDNPYFRQSSSQRILLDILFVFCKLNRDIGYRQGMHELLAPLLWVVERDAIEPKSLKQHRGSDGSGGLLRDVLDAKYIEHDVFTLFSLIMQTAKSFYELGDQDQESSGSRARQDSDSRNVSPIIARSRRIHQDYLARVDPELAQRLKDLDILPQVFLIRWVRLLFGREFPFNEVLALWDAMFAEDPRLDLVDLVCVAMMVRVRWQLIEADYSTALTILLRYPPTSPQYPAVTFAQDAIYLKQNLSVAGGIHLITKYSKKPPVSRSSKDRQSRIFSKADSGKGPEFNERGRPSQARPAFGSPARYVRQYGIEAVLQDAAKAMYTRGERWGVNQVVRDAVDEVRRNVQGLQSASVSPRPKGETSRWSLDQGRQVFEEPAAGLDADLVVRELQRRNRALAEKLEAVQRDLRGFSLRDSSKEQVGSNDTELFESAMTKLQLVRSCLEDPSISITEEADSRRPMSVQSTKSSTMPAEHPVPPKQTAITAATASASPPPEPSHARTSSEAPTAPIIDDPASASLESLSSDPFRSPAPVNRPSLEQSPFAWMLGGDNNEELGSQFKASFPSPATERRRQRQRRRQSKNGAKAGYLFGNAASSEGSGGGEEVGREGLEYDMGSMRGERKGGT